MPDALVIQRVSAHVSNHALVVMTMSDVDRVLKCELRRAVGRMITSDCLKDTAQQQQPIVRCVCDSGGCRLRSRRHRLHHPALLQHQPPLGGSSARQT